MSKNWKISRRSMLKGVGSAMALPMLDIMGPSAFASTKTAGAAAKAPVRMGFWFVPNGVIPEHWNLRQQGAIAGQELPQTLEPLKGLENDFTMFSGLMHDKGRANGDGAGDHARSAACYLTGTQARKTSGADIRLGKSVDQYAAEGIGMQTKLPSLELGLEAGRNAGQCDSGYSCAYSNNISWKTESTPMSKEVNPRLVFERLFGDAYTKRQAEKMRAKRRANRKSILDYVADDSRALLGKASHADKNKLDEYFTAVRELEQRIERAEKLKLQEREETFDLPESPEGIPGSFAEHAKLMVDMQVLAFQTDSTRVITFMVGNAGSNRNYRPIGVPEGHHHLSHHRKKQDWIDKLSKINRYHMEQFAYFVKKMKSIREGDGTLLDNTMLLYGSGIADGNRHSHHALPALLAGRAGGAIKPGRHIVYPKQVPMNNLFLSMLDIMGTPIERMGDSTGRLHGFV